jgi:2-polyprenyl-6-methoxyphenol hydroxylase-like FAD-dependent oxidoreductase
VVTGVPVPAEHVRGQFAGLGPRARRLLELGSDWRTWVLCDRDPVREWVDGRVVLLGDAAHPMLQYAAQGACMALEDAVLLGVLLDCTAADIPLRLAKFRDERRERTSQAQLVARAMGELYHPHGAEARTRDARLSGMSQEELRDTVAWLHGGP